MLTLTKARTSIWCLMRQVSCSQGFIAGHICARKADSDCSCIPKQNSSLSRTSSGQDVPLLHSTAQRNPILDESCLNDRAISLSSFDITGVLDLEYAVQADKGQHILKQLFRFFQSPVLKPSSSLPFRTTSPACPNSPSPWRPTRSSSSIRIFLPHARPMLT